MPGPPFALLLTYPATLPDEALREFRESVERPGLVLEVDRRERGPQAGLEWLLPTMAALFFAGFLGKAGEDSYEALKAALRKLWPVFFGKDRIVTVTSVASSPKKLASPTYSRAFSLMVRDARGRTIKLLLRDDASPEELDATVDAFLGFLRVLATAQTNPGLTFTGAVALVTYDREIGELRTVHPHDDE